MILSTQNPVDLDYKAMSNAEPGWWGVCRPRTTRSEFSKASPAPRGRRRGHDKPYLRPGEAPVRAEHYKVPEPTQFGTRWAMSYLAGPLTRDQVSVLMKGRSAPAIVEAPATTDGAAPIEPVVAGPVDQEDVPVMPAVSEGGHCISRPRRDWAGEVGRGPDPAKRLTAMIAATVNSHMTTRRLVSTTRRHSRLSSSGRTRPGARYGGEIDHDPRDFRSDPPEGAAYVLPEQKIDTKSLRPPSARI